MGLASGDRISNGVELRVAECMHWDAIDGFLSDSTTVHDSCGAWEQIDGVRYYQ
jgi:hypothetical protein